MALPTSIKQHPGRSRLPLRLAVVPGGPAVVGIFLFALLLERLKSFN